MMFKKIIGGCSMMLGLMIAVHGCKQAEDATVIKQISKEELLDKIKGGWAGQTIGTTYGWTTEFLYAGTYIQDYERLPWHDDYVNQAMREFPGLYDDVYMDLMFVDVFEKKGLQATPADFSEAFAKTEFQLWHANQAGRYNVQNGVAAEKAGHWLNNPHADDIDFQIEADFAGLMSPGMPKVATQIATKTGQLVNSGDGLYGGIFVANMYSQAFMRKDIKAIITNALQSIPKESLFYQTIADVIEWHKQYPNDWKQTWFKVQEKWSEDVGCPNMVFHPLNIDAKINAAYVVMGLLYGNGDFTKTAEIATRTGQDSDCNPATALGVLGTMIGYKNIPEFWKTPVVKAESTVFSHSTLALKDVYEIGLKHALANLEANGGKVDTNTITFPAYEVSTAAFEQNFKGHYPKERIKLNKVVQDELSFEVEGIGFVLRGWSQDPNQDAQGVLVADMYINGEKIEQAKLPSTATRARTDLFWRYQLPAGKHQVTIKIVNRQPSQQLSVVDYLVYDNKANPGIRQ